MFLWIYDYRLLKNGLSNKIFWYTIISIAYFILRITILQFLWQHLSYLFFVVYAITVFPKLLKISTKITSLSLILTVKNHNPIILFIHSLRKRIMSKMINWQMFCLFSAKIFIKIDVPKHYFKLICTCFAEKWG